MADLLGRGRWPGVLAWVLFLSAAVLAGGARGRIEGRITRADGGGLANVRVTIEGLGRSEISDDHGRFLFDRVAPGSYTISFVLGKKRARVSPVVLHGDATVVVKQKVDWQPLAIETLTVHAASRRREPISQAPAAITALSPGQIELQRLSDTVPRMLAAVPGIELDNGALGWFVINARGFTSGLNRGLPVFVDGRELTVPGFRAVEWWSLGNPIDDLSAVELVRGPLSALYGENALSGALSLTTKSPKEYPGGTVRFGAGEHSTRRLDLRYAGSLNNDWYFKISGSSLEADTLASSRTTGVEYSRPCEGLDDHACLPLEAAALVPGNSKRLGGSLRLDKYFGPQSTLTMEAGTSQFEARVPIVTSAGRMQTPNARRPWTRIAYSSEHWHLMAHYNEHDAEYRILSSGAKLYDDSRWFIAEVMGNGSFAAGRGTLIAGASFRSERSASADPQGVETVYSQPVRERVRGLFGQLEYQFTNRLRGLLAARWDDYRLLPSQFSPRLALVFEVAPGHNLRFSYGRAYKTPTLGGLFMKVPLAAPIDLSPLEAACAMFDVSCGFDQPVPVLAVGNDRLDAERVESLELGYRAVIGRHLYLTADLFRARHESFQTDLTGTLNSRLGWLNPSYLPYSPPAGLPPPAAQALTAALQENLPPDLYAVMATAPDGSPAFVPLTFANFGEVETRGAEIGLSWMPSDRWSVDFSYTRFDFDVQDQLPDNPILANTAPNKYGLAIGYRGDRFGGALSFRRTTAFDWRTGIFWGQVPTHQIVNCSASYAVTSGWEIGIDVDNLLDSNHFEQFGGELLRRRASLFVSRNW